MIKLSPLCVLGEHCQQTRNIRPIQLIQMILTWLQTANMQPITVLNFRITSVYPFTHTYIKRAVYSFL